MFPVRPEGDRSPPEEIRDVEAERRFSGGRFQTPAESPGGEPHPAEEAHRLPDPGLHDDHLLQEPRGGI